MAQIAAQESNHETVEATLNYLLDTGQTPWAFTGGPGSTERRSFGEYDPRKVVIHNGRPMVSDFELDRQGFRFIRHDTRVKDFSDEEEVRSVYYPEMQELVKELTAASRVVVFDHTLRTADEAVQEARKIREPVLRVHNDYTEWSGPQRVRDLLPDEADTLLERRFAIVQIWRPIRMPVESAPLAICDAKTLSTRDLVISERRYPNRVGQTYGIKFSPDHRWYWFPMMRREEALVFKVYDSLKDGRARWTAHTAFDHPTVSLDAPPRESIEIRSFAFFAS